MDFSFNLQDGVYSASTLDLVINAFINAWCIVFGCSLPWYPANRPKINSARI